MSKTDLDFKIGADMKQFRSAMGNIDHSLKKLSGGFGALGGVIGASFAVDAIQRFVGDSVQLAAETEGVRNAFERLNDPNLLGDLRKATKGTVADLELMKSAVKAKNFNIPLEQLSGLLGFAQQRATETGESIDYMVESIVLGIARKSIPILDNLGFSATEVREEFNKTGDMAVAVGNIIEKQMLDGADATLTLSEQIAQQQASIKNLKTEVGEGLAPVYKSFLDQTKSALESMNLLLGDQVDGFSKLGYIASFFTGQAAQAQVYRDAVKIGQEALSLEQQVRNEARNGQRDVQEYRDALKAYEDEKLVAALKAQETLDAYENKLKDLIPTIKAATYEIQKMFTPQGGDGAGLAKALGFDDVDTTLEDIDETEERIEEFENGVFKSFEQINAERERLQQGFMMMGGAIQSAMSAALGPLEEGETRIGNFADVFVQELKRMLVQLAATAAAAAALAAIMSIVFGGAGAAGAKIFGKNGMGFGDLFGSAFSGMGGGFGFSGGASQGMQGGIPIYGVLSGQDILLSTDRAGRNRTRQRGF